MTQRFAATTAVLLVSLVALQGAFLPRAARADVALGSDLQTTIRAQLLSDPRTTGLPAQQIDALVGILSGEAQKQGLTASDLTWHPQIPQSFITTASELAPAPSACGAAPWYLCIFGEAFGFLGFDVTIPYILGVASMGLVWVIAEMIHHRRKRAPEGTPVVSGM
jgi:hypothetical protein